MDTTSYVLVCERDKTFTSLHRFDRKRNVFEGEYSLLHNAYSYDQYFLARFLMAHVEHPLRLLPSDNERYDEVVHTYQRFQEDDIPAYIEEKLQERAEREHRLDVERSLGQLQLIIARQMILKEREEVQNRPSRSERETLVLIGQDYAFLRSVHIIDDIVAQGRG
ncbi:hypothetical protein GCM10010885_23620 [Alicyclobacillus cellulosilyticus]|uniref:Uncharacterized protein n=1 Tax=Alicyclobacillus cellulosilyticus TaxID=1003997 RepID=A0A917NNE6_9BACL|nr:hypothetical protein [Alicyclobacillus cellulosilyticus]GGJ13598.1 hypothetical protein GCM10010885_23620 [Alicyclobacillus cellulosilyticus]